jgi:TIR domain/Ricin-type beta-trefoil lectin domain
MNGKPDFFISYTRSDRPWAEWIAWILEAAGYHVVLQHWDFVPGCTWPERVDDMAQAEVRTIAILSPDYLGSAFAKAEWLAAWRTSAEGGQRKLVPVKVADCHTSGLLAGIATVDLTGLDEAGAEKELGTRIPAVISGRAKPAAKPRFPGATGPSREKPPQFAGPNGPDEPPHSPSPLTPPVDRAAQTASAIPARPRWHWLAAIATTFAALAVIILLAVPASPDNGRQAAPSANSPVTPESSRATESGAPSSGPPPSQSTVKAPNTEPTSVPLPGGDVTLRNAATGDCADSTGNGDVFTFACEGGGSQLWSALPVSGSVYALKEMMTGLCLTGTTQGGLSSAACDAADPHQQWRWSEQGSRGSLTHLSNGHCLVDLGAEDLTTAACDGAADQDWQIAS